ncbi:hypothetical protein [Streptomyces misionensis]|uniref:hypothetical protein n=1 Tax=Streptomyces misionensis TaxID=67331 RepID=UPI0036CDB751
MENSKQLREALEVAQNQLAAAEAELLEARTRVHHLRAAVYSLRELLAQEPADHRQGELFRSEEPLTASTVRVDQRTALPEDAGAARPPDLGTPAERAVAVLADAGRPLRMRDIRHEWERRGWVDPAWRTPASAINMIYQRALKAGKVGRMADGSWVLPMRVQDELARRRHGVVHGIDDQAGDARD